MRGLYAILDLTALEARSFDVLEAARAVVAARPACMQLRAKGAGAKRTLELLRELRTITSEHGVLLFANDRPDLAVLSKADGAHLGQNDVPPDLALDVAERTKRPLLVGRSTHNEEQLDAALEEPIDYVAIGPVFSTSSKADHDPVLGIERARALARRAKAARPTLPTCAIGGIDLARAQLLAVDFDLVAVIGALLEGAERPSDMGDRARALVSTFGPSALGASSDAAHPEARA